MNRPSIFFDDHHPRILRSASTIQQLPDEDTCTTEDYNFRFVPEVYSSVTTEQPYYGFYARLRGRVPEVGPTYITLPDMDQVCAQFKSNAPEDRRQSDGIVMRGDLTVPYLAQIMPVPHFALEDRRYDRTLQKGTSANNWYYITSETMLRLLDVRTITPKDHYAQVEDVQVGIDSKEIADLEAATGITVDDVHTLVLNGQKLPGPIVVESGRYDENGGPIMVETAREQWLGGLGSIGADVFPPAWTLDLFEIDVSQKIPCLGAVWGPLEKRKLTHDLIKLYQAKKLVIWQVVNRVSIYRADQTRIGRFDMNLSTTAVQGDGPPLVP